MEYTEYTLMHKNIPVVDMDIDITGYISSLGALHDSRHLPIGVRAGTERRALNNWWFRRSIPASRIARAGQIERL